MIVSSDRTTRQVDHVPHADPVGDFPQFSRGWPRRSGPPNDRRGAFPSRAASAARANPAARRSRPAPPRSRLFPGERVGPYFRPECLANTARHKVIPARHRHINQFGSGDRYLGNLLGAPLLYAMPVDSSRSCSLLVVKNHHRDRSSQHHPRARAAESAFQSSVIARRHHIEFTEDIFAIEPTLSPRRAPRPVRHPDVRVIRFGRSLPPPDLTARVTCPEICAN